MSNRLFVCDMKYNLHHVYIILSMYSEQSIYQNINRSYERGCSRFGQLSVHAHGVHSIPVHPAVGLMNCSTLCAAGADLGPQSSSEVPVSVAQSVLPPGEQAPVVDGAPSLASTSSAVALADAPSGGHRRAFSQLAPPLSSLLPCCAPRCRHAVPPVVALLSVSPGPPSTPCPNLRRSHRRAAPGAMIQDATFGVMPADAAYTPVFQTPDGSPVHTDGAVPNPLFPEQQDAPPPASAASMSSPTSADPTAAPSAPRADDLTAPVGEGAASSLSEAASSPPVAASSPPAGGGAEDGRGGASSLAEREWGMPPPGGAYARCQLSPK